MKQYLQRIFLFLSFISVHVAMNATNEPIEVGNDLVIKSMIGNDEPKVSITAQGNAVQLQVVGAQGAELKIYDLVGRLKYAVRIDSNDKTVRINLNKGVYLLNVGKQTRKFTVAG